MIVNITYIEGAEVEIKERIEALLLSIDLLGETWNL